MKQREKQKPRLMFNQSTKKKFPSNLETKITGITATRCPLIMSEAMDEKLFSKRAQEIWSFLSPVWRDVLSSTNFWTWDCAENFITTAQAAAKARLAATLVSSLTTGNNNLNSMFVYGLISGPTFWTNKVTKLATPTLLKKKKEVKIYIKQ